jgi:hypothetical protein
LVSAALPSIYRKYGTSFSPLFITTTATLPSGLIKAVERSALRLGELTIRFAPGRMNLEKCPM